MPEFLEDPSVLTKEKLKTELLANNVSLPSGDQRKDVYVQLYLKHLTAKNRSTPEFSSDDERESTPLRGRGRPPGRKATKKTDKPRAEEKDNLDVTELSNEALKNELVKYGVAPGPIIGSTRKVYEQRLLKLKEQASIAAPSPLVADMSSAGDNKQNGNTDSEHYSDNEDEPKIDMTFEKREPLRSKQKAQVTVRSRRTEMTETIEDTDGIPELNVKRSNRSPPVEFTAEVEELFTNDLSTSEDVVNEPAWTPGPLKSGRVQALSKEITRVSRRTPRKRDVTADSLPFDADITETTSKTETITTASNQIPAYTAYEHFESRQVHNQVPQTFKHKETLLSVNEYSDLSRRTPKKQLMSEKVVEKTFEEKITEKDILKEMFPHEVLTPTGISASCRRPIRGAAGRPLSLKDYKIDESYTKYVSSKYTPVVEVKTPSVNVKSRRSIPMWIKILLFVIVAVFAFLVYQAMETNEGNPFSNILKKQLESSKTEN
ncbi:thymopoietin isoform X1 [Pelobates cultripes]|uniref:Thymopoietin isoform X1 n=1 Tax=Pelobates cultripes TaxID=61616 RepID=A0AAD1RSA5_PELCU|nr:thymopoietin isoform X1 [Pelobates cultripes]